MPRKIAYSKGSTREEKKVTNNTIRLFSRLCQVILISSGLMSVAEGNDHHTGQGRDRDITDQVREEQDEYPDAQPGK